MASTSEDWDLEEALAKWRRLGELGLEAGLLEAGCSEEDIAKICQLDRSQAEIKLEDLVIEERAALLAMVGRAGSSVTSLKLFDRPQFTQNDAAALCANLTSNTNIKNLDVWGNEVFATVKGCTLLGNALRANSTLQYLRLERVHMEDLAVKCLMDGLQENKTLLSLCLYLNRLSEEGIKSMAEFITSNMTLKTLELEDIHFGFTSATYISSALGRNSTLEELHVGSKYPLKRKTLLKLLEPFFEDSRESEIVLNTPKNTTIRKLELSDLVSGYVNQLKSMIRMNKSLSTLILHKAQFQPKDWRDKIFPALKENKTIQTLILSHSEGFTGKDVENALIDLLQSSKIGLTRVNLGATNISNLQGRVNEELRLNREYRTRLQGQVTVQSMAGRLVLCGFGYAGKTTISETMEGICHKTAKSRYNSFKRKIKQTFPRLQQIFFGDDAYRELASRTRGFNVISLDTEGYLKSIWDFADHTGARKSEERMRTDCEYWMKFIASNAKPHLAGDSDKKQLPHVRCVMTNKDTLTPSQLHESKQWAQHVVRDLKKIFEDVLQLCETVEFVDAHSSEDVEHLVTLTDESLKEILEHQREYTICQDVRNILAKHQVDNHVMSLDDFYNLDEGRFNFNVSPMPIKEAVIAYLNDSGEVIFPKGFEFILINPRWFGISVLGSLIDTFKGVEGDAQPACTNLCRRHMESFGLVHRNGFADRTDMKDLLNNCLQLAHLQHTISSEKLIDLMIHLELCFESQLGNVDSPVFFPALFDDDKEAAAKGERQLEWKLVQSEKSSHLGRRLECENKEVTFLTLGFFPRLQVCLRNYFHEKNWTKNSVFHVDRNLICFGENGIEVLVEYSGEVGYFLDILVRYSKAHVETLKFIDEHVINKIQDFCASPQGCQGVVLVEAVIRPVCVQDLRLCVHRRDHSVLISTLKEELENDRGYKHIWTSPIRNRKDMDYAMDLLEGQDSYKCFLAASRVAEILETSSSTSSRTFAANSQFTLQQELPRLPTTKDVGMLTKWDACIQLNQKIPIASSSTTNSIPRLKQINDSIYIFQETPNPKVQVFFFHDLNWRQYDQPHIQSWMSSGIPSVCWPVDWLPAKYCEVQILLANYDAGPWKTNTDGHMRLQTIAENFRHDILSIYTKDCPLVLVGHGLGGLVIKELARSLQRERDELERHLHAHQHSADNKDFLKLDSLLKNVRGVLFFAPPFLGSRLIDYTKSNLRGSLLEYMEVMNAHTAELNEWFRKWRQDRPQDSRCKVTTIIAALPTEVDLPSEVALWYQHLTTDIVMEGAARFDTDSFYTSRADHFSVCKLRNETDSSFRMLTELIGPII